MFDDIAQSMMKLIEKMCTLTQPIDWFDECAATIIPITMKYNPQTIVS